MTTLVGRLCSVREASSYSFETQTVRGVVLGCVKAAWPERGREAFGVLIKASLAGLCNQTNQDKTTWNVEQQIYVGLLILPGSRS